MKYFFLIYSIFILFPVYGQDTIYLDKFHEVVKKRSDANCMKVLYYDHQKSKIELVRIFDLNNIMLRETYYSDYVKGIKHGPDLLWANKKIIDSCVYKNGKRDGERIKYWHNGNPLRIENYNDGKFVSGKYFDSIGIEKDFFPEMTEPEYPGGIDSLYIFIAKNFVYPDEAKSQLCEGTVYVSFVVNKSGEIENIKVLRGVCQSLDAEAIRVVKSMPKWTPGTQEGKIVKVRYTLPIIAKLQDEKRKKKRRKK